MRALVDFIFFTYGGLPFICTSCQSLLVGFSFRNLSSEQKGESKSDEHRFDIIRQEAVGVAKMEYRCLNAVD